jgi:O-antigen/teichoic acid export membrane protein
MRAVTSFLSPEQYGQLALLLVVQTFCGLFLINPIGMYINRYTHVWWCEGSLLARLRIYKKYVFTVSLIGGVSVFTVVKNPSLIELALTVLAMVLMVNVATWNGTLVALLNMVGQRGSAVSWGVVTSFGNLLASALLCLVWPNAAAWFIGQVIGYAIGAAGARLVLHRIAPSQKEDTLAPLIDRQTILTFCLPLALGTGFMWIQSNGYRLMVEHYWGLSLLGFLSVGLLLANQIWSLVETLAQQFLMPLFYKRISQADQSTASLVMSDLLNVLVPIYLVMIGMTFVGAPYLLKLLLAPQYAEAEIFMKIGSSIEFCRVMANLLGSAAQVTKKTSSIVMPYAFGAVVLLILLVIVATSGLTVYWVAICLLCASAVMLVSMWTFMLGEIKFHPDFRRWAIASIIMFAIGLPALLLDQPDEWIQVVLALSAIGLVGGTAITLLLNGNEALQRFLRIELQKEKIAT